jgi:hypothetical protein
MSKIAGTHILQVDGTTVNVVGNWTFNLGVPEREALVGPDGVHGYKETPRVPFVEGEVRNRAELDIKTLASTSGATVTLALANGKVIVLRDAWAAGEWTGNTEDANLPARFEGKSAEEIS